MSSDVSVYCKACVLCASRKGPVPHHRAAMATDQSSFPLQSVGLDLLGPLPTTSQGNKYVAVICDYFTKWTEAIALPDISAATVASAFVDVFVCRYGAPISLHTDQGPQFTSQLFTHVCDLLGIYKTRTSPYRPQSDGLVERMNRTLAAMLSVHVDSHHSDWDVHLQRCSFAYRSSVHSSTDETPAMLMFGHKLRLPMDIMFHDKQVSSFASPSDYLPALQQSLTDAFQRARQAGAAAQRRPKARV